MQAQVKMFNHRVLVVTHLKGNHYGKYLFHLSIFSVQAVSAARSVLLRPQADVLPVQPLRLVNKMDILNIFYLKYLDSVTGYVYVSGTQQYSVS